jgi:gas vesicle protein GvpG
MGLLAWTVGLPILPMRGVIWLGEIIERRAAQQLRDPGVARRQLEDMEEAARSGELTAEAQAEIEWQVTQRLVTPAAPRNAPRPEV